MKTEFQFHAANHAFFISSDWNQDVTLYSTGSVAPLMILCMSVQGWFFMGVTREFAQIFVEDFDEIMLIKFVKIFLFF